MPQFQFLVVSSQFNYHDVRQFQLEEREKLLLPTFPFDLVCRRCFTRERTAAPSSYLLLITRLVNY